MKIKTFIINIEESLDRRNYVLAETAKYPCLDVELVNAVYGKQLPKEETNRLFDCKLFRRRYLRSPSPAEIGCTLSHRKCYHRLLESSEKCALILEDDVCFLESAHLEDILSEIVKKTVEEKDACIVTLARHSHYYPHALYELGNYSIYRIWMAFGTCAYLINRKAAQILLMPPKASIYADDFEYMNDQGIRIEGIYPTLAAGLSEKGEIQSEIEPMHTSSEKVKDLPFVDCIRYLLKNKKRGFLKYMGVLRFRKREKGINI